MEHPLANPSLAPMGFVFPKYQERLTYEPGHYISGDINGEVIAARLWEQMHSASAPTPYPLETIIHYLLPGMETALRAPHGDIEFSGKRYASRDIRFLSSAAQWLGTGCGGGFLAKNFLETSMVPPEQEFIARFAYLMERGDMVAMWADRKQNNADEHTARDHALVHAFMWWLGKPAGTNYRKQLDYLLKDAFNAARKNDLRQAEPAWSVFG